MTPSTLITVAPTGAETDPSAAPGLPVTLDQLVETAVACQSAGAAMIHVHVRDETGASSMDLARLRDAVSAVRTATRLVVQLSTGGAVHDSEADRLRSLDAEPDVASLTCGTVNFGDDVFVNRWPFVVELYTRMQERRILPEFECFDLGQVVTLNRLLDRHGAPFNGHVHVDFVLGVAGGMPGTASALSEAVSSLPAGATWSATGVGRAHLPVMYAALALGGNLRVGMEDVLTWAPGVPVRDNAQLVTRAAQLAEIAQRPALDPDGARALLGLQLAAPAAR